MIDRSLNYGRHAIESYLNKCTNSRVIVDIGAGQGDDLLLAKKANQNAKLFGVEIVPQNQSELK